MNIMNILFNNFIVIQRNKINLIIIIIILVNKINIIIIKLIFNN